MEQGEGWGLWPADPKQELEAREVLKVSMWVPSGAENGMRKMQEVAELFLVFVSRSAFLALFSIPMISGMVSLLACTAALYTQSLSPQWPKWFWKKATSPLLMPGQLLPIGFRLRSRLFNNLLGLTCAALCPSFSSLTRHLSLPHTWCSSAFLLLSVPQFALALDTCHFLSAWNPPDDLMAGGGLLSFSFSSFSPSSLSSSSFFSASSLSQFLSLSSSIYLTSCPSCYYIIKVIHFLSYNIM